ncbi:MAG: hypothetical protein Q7S14_00450 [bacterium]|nr:hypothetical protein [bacterium]
MIKKLIILVLALTALGLTVWKYKIDKPQIVKNKDVSLPSIIGGELVLPKVDLTLNHSQTAQSVLLDNQILVVSATLVGVYSQQQSASESGQLTGIRVLGEMANPGKNRINNFLAVVKFFDNEGNLKTQKIANFSANYGFYGLDPQGRGVYDVTVDAPPLSDRIEVVLKPQDGDKTAHAAVNLKVASRSAEIQSVTAQNGQTVDVYVIKGEVVNTTDTGVADIIVNAYVKDTDGRVFGLNKESFKSDLIRPGETIPFKVMVLPVKTDSVYDDFVVDVWGREYKL